MTKILVFCQMPAGRASPVFGPIYLADAVTSAYAEDYWDAFGDDGVVQAIPVPEPMATLSLHFLTDYIALLVRDPQALSLWAHPF